MTRADESRPLLAQRRGGADTDASASPSSHSFSARWSRSCSRLSRHLRSNWSIVRILVVALLWGMGSYGAAPSYLDGLRAYTCAYHYSTHPHLLPKTPHPRLPADRDRPCAVTGVESKVGVIVAAATMLSFVVSSFSMLFYAPRLSRWGRKPMLVISLVSNIINYFPFVLLPLGYPFGDIPSELPISPITSMGLILLASFLVGLTGFAGLFLCVMRVMIVDVAPPTRRTVTLNWLISATLVGAFFGPLLAAWALENSVRVKAYSAGALDAVLFGTSISSSPAQLDEDSDPGLTFTPPIPGAPKHASKHGNPAALVACCWVFLLAIIWSILVVPETNPGPAAPDDDPDSSEETRGTVHRETSPTHPDVMGRHMLRASKVLGPLAMYLPQTARDGSKDYRLTWLALAGMFANIGTNALQYVAIFAGYRFDFTPDAIGLLLGLIGATRAVWLVFAIPVVVVLFERVVRKPALIRRLDREVLEGLARVGLKDVPGSTPRVSGPVGAEPTLAERVHAEAVHGRPTIRAVVLWRTAIDIAIAKLSYAADIIGYTVVFLSASVSNANTMVFGTLFLSFGAGAGPAVASAAIAIIQDMKHSHHPSLDPSLHPSPTDDWLAALSISDNLANGITPILMSIVYSLTIESNFPSTCFLVPTIGYILSFAFIGLVSTHES
ncbi:hypothetical protein BCV70DRAFT_198199 [Testicularia cyperi]|uniref:MFS general substrate transporter n=1 Tax=Testicularia cyperi TaxID=1882483 RepID=A0A317XUC9_9BASI|nr:hypothetical protein BCV70DRAFT_198199 [Testicularia cyperi]